MMQRSAGNRSPRHCSGFSLVELLVVISVVTLLVALLLPALTSARDAAKRTQSLSQARQITLALHVYSHDNDATLPWAAFGVFDNGGSFSATDPYWSEKLVAEGYLTDQLIFWSPDRLAGGQPGPPANPDRYLYDPYYRATGYGVNTWGPMPTRSNAASFPDKQLEPWRLDRSGVTPANVLLMAETSGPFFDSHGRDGWSVVNVGQPYPLYSYNGAVVQTYMDGHGRADNARSIGWQITGDRSGLWLPGYLNQAQDIARQAPWYSQW